MKKTPTLQKPAIALFQPDIPQNVGACMRLCRCLGMHLHIIEPCGFLWDMRKIRQAALDYIDEAHITRHLDWSEFMKATKTQRKILLTTKASQNFCEFAFSETDILLAGRESAGAPDYVHASVSARLKIPLQGDARSLNVITALTLCAGEALRQNGYFTITG